MKLLIIPFFAICLSISAKAQTFVKQDTSCSFLKNLKFKNGVDTIVVKGIYLSLIQRDPFTGYEERFLKKRRINKNQIGAVIEFQPENCTESFTASLMVYADKENFIDGDNAGISIIVTCVVFEGYLGHPNHLPYVLVIKVVPKKPIGSL